MSLWVPPSARERQLICTICGSTWRESRRLAFEAHLKGCIERHSDYIDQFRGPQVEFGDPELAEFARSEGDVYNRRPGTRRRPR